MEHRLPILTERRLQDATTLDFIKAIACTASGEAFADRFPNSPNIDVVERARQQRVRGTKSAVDAGTPTAGNWGEHLYATPRELGRTFVAYQHPFTIMARLGLRATPFNARVSIGTAPMTFRWVGAGQPKPVGRATTTREVLSVLKASGIAAVSDELFRVMTDAAFVFVRDGLRQDITAWLDAEFTGDDAGVDDVRPAGLAAGVTPITSAGDPGADFAALLADYVAAGAKVERAAVVLSSRNAVALKLTGDERYRELTRDGGRLGGLPAVCSDGVGDRVLLIDTGAVFVADEGDIDVEVARQASIEMSDDPANEVRTVVSMWQSNTVALRVDRFINWVARPGAVSVVENADYVTIGSPEAE